MRTTTLFTLAAVAVASVSAFSYPDTVPLHRRQAPGTPQYECHADCGGIITLSRTEGYCELANFSTTLTDCLNCALEFDIWQYYGESVTTAAENCGLDATPVPANGTSNSTTTGSATASETTGSATATSASADATTTESAPTSATASASESSASESSASESAASDTSSAAPAASTGGASTIALSAGLAMIPLGLVVAGIF